MRFGIVWGMCVNTVVGLDPFVDIVIKLVFTLVVLNFSKKNDSTYPSHGRIGRISSPGKKRRVKKYLFCPVGKYPFIGSCSAQLCIGTSHFFKLLAMSSNEKYGHDQTVKLLLVLRSFHSVTSCCEVSQGWTVTYLGTQQFTSASWGDSGTTRVSGFSLV